MTQLTTSSPQQDMHRRTELLLGKDKLHKLQSARVILFGVGGVGSWCAEALVRSGVQQLTIVDSDRVCATNCNRQLIATSHTVGRIKVEVLKERLLEINPEASITALQKVYEAATAETFRLETYDYIIDAIDSLQDKVDLILRATSQPSHITFVSSMGAALRRDPFMIRKSEFWKVKGDPLARAIRNKLKRDKTFPRRKFLCVYSEEPPLKNLGAEEAWSAMSAETPSTERVSSSAKAQINGSLCHITASFGMALAGIVLNDIVDK
ncbi:MAG: tRNA threonylcarbamoyladenosine dehydratase [Bacteroidales bacterium]|nr:tRNA threonylcarbamoyladenosine dehydratase [Candidatus Physcousia equi]